MTNRNRIVRAIVCLLFLNTRPARSQETTSVDVTSIAEQTRFGPAIRCGAATAPETPVISKQRLGLSLLIPGRQSYRVGEKLTFELTIRNMGRETVIIPTEACLQSSPIANHSGVTEACINLDFLTPEGESNRLQDPAYVGNRAETDGV